MSKDYDSQAIDIDDAYRAEHTAVVLATAVIRLQAGVQVSQNCRAICDSGAQLNLITKACVKRLQLPTMRCYKIVKGLAGEETITRKIRAYIHPWFKASYALKAEIYVTNDALDGHYPSVPINAQPPEGVVLADPEFNIPAPVEMLFGAGVWADIMGTEMYRHSDGAIMQSTEFGYIILGRFAIKNNSSIYHSIFAEMDALPEQEETLDQLLRKFWEIEMQNDLKPVQTAQEEMAEKIFIEKHYRNAAGRYIVHLPLKPKVFPLPDTRGIALRQFYQLERRLQRNPEMHQKYMEFMRAYEKLGHMKQVNHFPPKGHFYYVPHHCVLNKFRVVFNASMKIIGHKTFNDLLLVGEKLQFDLTDQLMRMRRHKIAFVADIEKMFRQVGIDPSQWDLQRIFWRESPDQPLRVFQLTVVTYGMASSVHCAVRAMIQCARDQAKQFPVAAKAIENDTYIDDLSSGADTIEEAKLLAQEIDFVLKQGGFVLRQWASNSPEITKSLNGSGENRIELLESLETKILGMLWLTDTDEFAIRVDNSSIGKEQTKRQILSSIAKLFDPKGYLCPVLVRAKVLMQNIWRLQELKWDDKVPDGILLKWQELCRELPKLAEFRVERWLSTSAIVEIQLHGFSDASLTAYGACIYVRTQDRAGRVRSKLLIAKSRVAPVSKVSIPRLELCAAELLARLMKRVAMVCEFDGVEQFLWSDSTIVLQWLQKCPYNLKTFVANRVQAVHDHSYKNSWSYVKTTENPADLMTRGMQVNDFLKSDFWKQGPKWLLQPYTSWPKNKFPLLSDERMEVEKECRNINGLIKLCTSLNIKDKSLLYKYSCWRKIIRITAYVLRFIQRAKGKSKVKRLSARRRPRPQLNPDNLYEAAIYWIKCEQAVVYKKEIQCLQAEDDTYPEKSKIASLRPILKDNVLRVGGRIDKAAIDYDEKHPIIIPPGTRLCYLIIDQAHHDTMHGGVQMMMGNIRNTFWIPRLRQEIRCYISKCVRCIRESKKTTDQIMADLPADRIRPARPFTKTGVDMAGPVRMRAGENENGEMIETKGYIAVFVCLVTRAVHLEAVMDMSAKAFLDAFTRFAGRRGFCEFIYSDNGTNFTAANKELQAAVKSWQESEVHNFMMASGVTWRFITPAAPHQGGLWEAAVKQMKHHLKRIMGPLIYSFDALATLLAGIEACLNSRPICAMSSDPNDDAILTPAHFLIGGPLRLALPRRTNEQASILSGKKLYRTIQTQTEAFWECWSKEYLRTLMTLPKWRAERKNVRVGQLVLLESNQFAPTYWAMGRIIAVKPGADGKIRNVTIKVHGGTLERAVQRLCILPVDEDEQAHFV